MSRLSSVTAGICDYLMGLADYEKACFTVGFPRKGKMGRWTFGSQLNYAWRPDGCVREADTGSDGLLQVRIGRSGQQAGRSLDHAITYRGSRFKYFNQARWEKHAPIPSAPCLRYVRVLDKNQLFFLHQTVLLQNIFTASMQTEPQWELNSCILLLMKGRLEGARGSQVPGGCALKSLWVFAENWGCRK